MFALIAFQTVLSYSISGFSLPLLRHRLMLLHPARSFQLITAEHLFASDSRLRFPIKVFAIDQWHDRCVCSDREH